VSYLLSEALLRLIKPLIALLLGVVLYWVITGPFGEPGSALLGLACWISAGVLIQLLETGII
jgi:hypothetical protein